MSPRSTAGCYTCKRRKKKCDETQPHCLRCIRSGKECEGPLTLKNTEPTRSVAELLTGLPTPAFARLNPGMNTGHLLSYSPNDGNYWIDQHYQGVKFFQPSERQSLPGHGQLMGPGLPRASISEVKDEEDLEEGPKGPKQGICLTPVPDANTTDNTIPFILQCYARWVNLVVYEPVKGILPLKETIVAKFMRSPGERTRIILLANAVGNLGKSLKPGPRTTSLITYLRSDAYQIIDNFISGKPASEREVDQQNALETLDLMMETVLIQRYSNSMLTIAKLMDAAAPIFRRACPEPMDQYVNLPGAILSNSINIRHFATTDVIISITTGRPMIFRYDITYPPGVLELIKKGYGMQFLHGVADQYIVILAHINVLAEELEPRAPVSPELVTEIESQIREVEVSAERLADPVATIWKFTVRECWRLTMYVYLYMVLCRTATDDPRVLKSVRTFVRLMEAVKPGRNPDSFLYIPLIIVGASAYQKYDRAVIQRRMNGLQECINPGSCGYDALNMLIDLWARTEAEGRPAFWSDLRMSAFRVTGI
ncbi:hypothetical protein OPQ81_008144 [Rhizoctonia solani]|nr:hypothetical protein OPQ81_008144 [Rhizoctonia solani]